MDRSAEFAAPVIAAGLVGAAVGVWVAARRAFRRQASQDAQLLLAEMEMDMVPEGFHPVAHVTDVPDPGSKLVEIGERLVAVIHAAGHWYALDDVCTHDGGPLSEGPIDPEGRSIACPRHGAKFDLATGAALTMPATKPTVAHEVKAEGDQVLVRLPDS